MAAGTHPIYLIRHGAVSNPRGVRYRRLPGFRLSLRGWQQAQQVRRTLADVPLTGIVHSPLERAAETAEVINQSHGLPLAVDERIHEWGEGETLDHVIARTTDFWRHATQAATHGPLAIVGHQDPTRALLLTITGQLRDAHYQSMADDMPLPLAGIYKVTHQADGQPTAELIFAAS